MVFTEEMFQEALRQPRLRQPLPDVLLTRAEPIPVMDEDELSAMTRRWFAEYEAKIAFYADHGLDIGWTLEWAKKYWWSWLVRDMSFNHELYTDDLLYKDVTTMGGYTRGLKEFVDYNFAFFDAIPDWRYDPIPGQVFLDPRPDGSMGMAVRYYGSGHLVGPLKLHPYDDTAMTIPGNGAFVQCTAVDRYHFNADGLMYEGETLYDILDAVQTTGMLPAPQSRGFNAMMRTAGLANAVATRVRRVLP
ncbi:hypothetical protein ACFQ0K_05930 [Nocardioides caeni]|uniref:Nuclear transport factor 2 family protein n=1 Tax=Nocardioides caeni TaxID=574700 RepID=A0A4S8NAU1_9ACTN|nr:nuclear transport factor 2 family protein [Nocardioides caeni]THV13012.1 nuclear transport factor 2 family protein [Nocardioides caeni]